MRSTPTPSRFSIKRATSELSVIAPPEPRSVGDSRQPRLGRNSGWSWPTFSVVLAILVAIPVGLLAVSILQPNVEVWQRLWETRLPGQLYETGVLLVGVSFFSLVVGSSLAWLVSAYEFPGSKFFGWILIAPLAMPSYVLGFVALSVIGFTGPIQNWWRDVFGQDAWFPPVRSLGGAIFVFTLVLYPYVFLLARTALADQAGGAYEVARSLGAGPVEAARRVMMPLMRPALAAGTFIVAMETLTDFGTVQYSVSIRSLSVCSAFGEAHSTSTQRQSLRHSCSALRCSSLRSNGWGGVRQNSVKLQEPPLACVHGAFPAVAHGQRPGCVCPCCS